MKNYLNLNLSVLTFTLIFCCFVVPVSGSENAVIAPLASSSLLLDAQRMGDTLIVVGERGHILISENNGEDWQQMAVPTRATLTGIHFLDKHTGWVVGHDQVILRTGDGGQSWEKVYENITAESPLHDIFFLDANHGYAIGAYGQFMETFDGGSSWEGRWISEDDFHLNQMIAVGKHLFIAAEAGFVYRSADAGANWELLDPDYTGSFFGIYGLDEDSLLLFGLRGHLFRSDDSGASWIEIESGTVASLTSGLRLDDGTIVVTGLAGVLLISHDAGHSFSLYQDQDRKSFSRLLQAADGSVIAAGSYGTLQLLPDIFKHK